MVLLPYAAAGLILPTLCYAAAPTPQLYIHPSPFPPSLAAASDDPIVLTAPQTNAVLAHHLGVDKHVNWPIASTKQVGGRDWELALGDPAATALATALPTRQRVVVVLECGKQGCDDAIPLHLRPEANSGSRPIVLPALAPNSYLAALSLHLHRLADSLGLDPTAVVGLKDFVEQGIKAVKGWQGWVSEELGNWIGWHDVGDNVKATVVDEPKIDNAGLVNDLDLLDDSAKQLMFDLNKLANLTDSVVSSTRQHQAQNDLDSGAQGQADKPPVTVIHLTGLKDVAAMHSRSSDMYQRSARLLQQTLTAALAALAPPSPDGGVSSPDPKVILLALPEPKTPLLRRRRPWLEAFENGAGKQARGVGVAAKRNGGSLEKRNVFSPAEHSLRRRRLQSDEDGDNSGNNNNNNNNGTFLVPSSYRCFPSRAELVNLTASCLGHGQPVKGLTTRSDLPEGGECWVCKCGTTTDEETGKKTRWAGQGCEKVDLSSDFALLSLTTLGLLGVVALSVGLLYSIGAQELPGTLGAVGGDGGRMKRD